MKGRNWSSCIGSCVTLWLGIAVNNGAGSVNPTIRVIQPGEDTRILHGGSLPVDFFVLHPSVSPCHVCVGISYDEAGDADPGQGTAWQ